MSFLQVGEVVRLNKEHVIYDFDGKEMNPGQNEPGEYVVIKTEMIAEEYKLQKVYAQKLDDNGQLKKAKGKISFHQLGRFVAMVVPEDDQLISTDLKADCRINDDEKVQLPSWEDTESRIKKNVTDIFGEVVLTNESDIGFLTEISLDKLKALYDEAANIVETLSDNRNKQDEGIDS